MCRKRFVSADNFRAPSRPTKNPAPFGAGFCESGVLFLLTRRFVPHLRKTIMLPGCGHWTQQERPREVNAAILEFLASL